MPSKHYLITVYGDVEPELSEPFESEDEVLDAAIEHRREDPEKCDGLYLLEISENGEPSIDAFCGGDIDGFLEDEKSAG